MALSETHYLLESYRPGRSRYVSVPSLCLGLAGVVIINLWVTYTNYIVHSSHINLSQFPFSRICRFFYNRFLRFPPVCPRPEAGPPSR